MVITAAPANTGGEVIQAVDSGLARNVARKTTLTVSFVWPVEPP